LQKAAHKLNKTITEHCLTISAWKTKPMAFKGHDTSRSKIVIDNKIRDQVNTFHCLENLIL
jgi:hypothetical protein